MPIGDRHGLGSDARQEPQHPGKTFIVPEKASLRHSLPQVAWQSPKKMTGQRISAPSLLISCEQPQFVACSLVWESLSPHFWHRQKRPPQPGIRIIFPWQSGQVFSVSMSESSSGIFDSIPPYDPVCQYIIL
jgi:hypothetical protein